MPLEHSSDKAAIGRNIEKEQAAGKPHEQAVAIALHTADTARGHGGAAQNRFPQMKQGK